jgi:hypothetical protein
MTTTSAAMNQEPTMPSWSCVDIPDSATVFDTGKTVRVDVTVEDIKLENVGVMVTGTKPAGTWCR